MMKLFGAIAGAKPAAQETITPERYTRSPNVHKPRSAAVVAQERRPVAKPAVEKRVPGAAHQRLAREAVTKGPGISDTVHLHADTSIPVSILRKALPLRFARMNREVDEFVFS